MYDLPLGEPQGPAAKDTDGIWRRVFSKNTKVAFDPVLGNGTIWWGDGTVHTGNVQKNIGNSCVWATQ